MSLVKKPVGYLPGKQPVPQDSLTRRTIAGWNTHYDPIVRDPDGFDRTDPYLMDRFFTKEEYELGRVGSTLAPAPHPQLPLGTQFSGGVPYTVVWTSGKRKVWNVSRVKPVFDAQAAVEAVMRDRTPVVITKKTPKFHLIAVFEGWPKQADVEFGDVLADEDDSN